MDIPIFKASQIYLCDYEEMADTTSASMTPYFHILKLERLDKYLRINQVKLDRINLVSDKIYTRKYCERIPILDMEQMMLPFYFYKFSSIEDDSNFFPGFTILYIDMNYIVYYIKKMEFIKIVHTKPNLINMAIQI
jgi:hypothetical protein